MRAPDLRLDPSVPVKTLNDLPSEITRPQVRPPQMPPLSGEPRRGSTASDPPPKDPEPLATALDGLRCSEKGCVFPAGWRVGKCLHHDRQQREPALFCSRQPSVLLLDRAKFLLPNGGSEDPHGRDRRRLAALREAFLDDAA